MIEIIFLDVDGCLTDGKIIYNANGEELKFFDVKDGYAIESWLKLGKKVAIITGSEILKFEGLSFKNAAAIGDDYNDYKILDAVAWSFKPKDAIKELDVKTKLKHKGGNGAVREMIEMIIKSENLYDEWSKRWL